MDEFVSKKLLVAKFNELASKYIDGDKRQRGLAYTTAADMIALADATDVQPVDRWIKADVSLPVYDGMVLVCDKSKNIRLGIYTDMGWCSQFGNPMMCKITHWQPLPEPPKDGDTNG